jgi:hypothetical protein
MSKKRFAFWLSLCLLAPLGGNARVGGDVISNPPRSLLPFQSPSFIINEYLADPPSGTAGDANGDGVTSATQDEFIELVNAASAPLNIGGFSVGDALQTRFTFPPGASIPSG